MPVNFLSDEQKKSYAKYPLTLTVEQLHKYFHLDEKDKELIAHCRRDYNKLGYALQLTTVRFLGTFLQNPIAVPKEVINYVAGQVNLLACHNLEKYLDRKKTKFSHCQEIQTLFEYQTFSGLRRFRFTRWLYSIAWFGSERPTILFERAVLWLIAHKILLPGISTLEELIARIRDRAAERLWKKLFSLASSEMKKALENLLTVPEGKRYSYLDALKNGPTRISSQSLSNALSRYKTIKNLGARNLNVDKIPKTKIQHLARYVAISWSPSIARMPEHRRIAVLLAFAYVYEIKALDDALELLDRLITEINAQANRIGSAKRLRTLGDLDKSASKLSDLAELCIENDTSQNLSQLIYKSMTREDISAAIQTIRAIAKPEDKGKFYDELVAQYKKVRRFLKKLLSLVPFETTEAGKPLQASLKFLSSIEGKKNPSMENAPMDIVNAQWRRITNPDKPEEIDRSAYTLCVLDNLQDYLKSRDVYVQKSERWCDPRAKLIQDEAWENQKLSVCRMLNLPLDEEEIINNLTQQLDDAYQLTLKELPQNKAVNIVKEKNKWRIELSKLEKMEEPERLTQLRDKVAQLLPSIDLPELLLEVHQMTEFTNELTHINGNMSRVDDAEVSLCAVLMGEGCNIGLEAVAQDNVPALTRNRLSFVQQNHIRAETIARSNACLVDFHRNLPLTKKVGSGDIGSADGLRFVSAVKTINSLPNKKYYGNQRGMTYYNFLTDQFTGFHGIVVPGTLRDSLFLLDGILEHQTSVEIKEVMTDTAGASEIVFALFWLLGYAFSPRLADIGGVRFWRIDKAADYKTLNDISNHKVSIKLIKKHWQSILRIAGSLKLGHVSASELIRSLFTNNRPSGLAKALMNLGRIVKTMYLLKYIRDEDYRRHILIQLNKGESRHSLARAIYHGRRGEIHKPYREGQEDQLNILGLVTNACAVWNTVYSQSALDYLKQKGEEVHDDDLKHFSFIMNAHINILGRFSFTLPKKVSEGALRDLNVDLET